MALVFTDLTQETTSTIGTGTLTLTGAVVGFQTFANIGNGNTTYYRIRSGNDSEVGIGTYTSSGTTLSRDTVLSSIIAGVVGTTKITVASEATVICAYPAEKVVILDGSNNATGLGTPAAFTGTNIQGTATAFNINGTVGASTPNTGAFTTLSASSTFSAGTSTTDTAAFSGIIYRGTSNTTEWVSINGTDPTTSTTSRGISFRGTFAATATGAQSGFFMSGVGASSGSAYTTTNVYGLQIAAYILGTNQTVTNQYGVYIFAQPTATNIYSFYSAAQTNGTNNYAFYGNTPSGTGRWNVYANGTAANYFNGNVLIGTTTQPATASNIVIAGLKATSAAAPTIASATTIAPTKQITFISGTTAIATITAPDPISTGGGQITLIPTGIFTTTTAGNIALASVAVVSKALIMTYDTTTAKWYPSY